MGLMVNEYLAHKKLPNCVPFCIPLVSIGAQLLLLSLATFDTIRVDFGFFHFLNFRHTDRCVMVCHCGFSFQFPKD